MCYLGWAHYLGEVCYLGEVHYLGEVVNKIKCVILSKMHYFR
jgi:hypothetical protein